MSNQNLIVIAKPTHDCNLSCRYCYVEDSAEKGKMSQEILEESIKKVSDFTQDSHWIWHGGEPLMMGIDFFKQIKNIQDFYKKKGKKFSNGIQTNGTLISNEILDFIESQEDFYLGLSLDGPKKINDKTRIYTNGKGSFKKIMNGLDLINRRKKYVGGGAICVINSKNIDNPKELYEFFKEEKINVKFNPLIKSGKANKNQEELGITPLSYGKFLLKMWDIYENDVKKEGKVTIDVDPFMEFIGNLDTKIPHVCNYSSSCRENFISIGPRGDIYPCGRFDGIKEFWMGNVKLNSIEEAVNSEINKNLKERNLDSFIECKSCNNKKICNAGCMHNAYCEGDVFGKDPYCVSYKILYNKLNKILNIEKKKAERRLTSNEK